MDAFEKACSIENYTGESTQENVIEWIRGDKEATMTIPNRTVFANKIRKLAKAFPDEVEIIIENKDKSIVAHIPVNYIHLYRPRELSEKTKEKYRDNLKSVKV